MRNELDKLCDAGELFLHLGEMTAQELRTAQDAVRYAIARSESLRDVGVTDANFAFEEGWRLAAEWAKRDDLVDDIGSPAYIRDRDAMLFKAAPSGDEGDNT